MSNIDDIVKNFQRLNLEQQQTVSRLIEALGSEDHNNPPPSRSNRITGRQRNSPFISATAATLAIGDTVRIITHGKTGHNGDIAIVQKINKTLVAVKLQRNGSITHRAAKNLELVHTTTTSTYIR